MKKTLALILCAALFAALFVPVSAASVSVDEAAGTLSTLGLLLGGGDGLEMERSATRAEAAVMLLRLLGLYDAAEAAALESPFFDAGWAGPYLGFAYDAGLVRGRTGTYYGSDESVSARDYVTMALRALGYVENVDFTYWTSLSFSDAIGLTHGEYEGEGKFIRGDMALISYTALTLKPKGGDRRLIEVLCMDGAVTAEALKQTRLASVSNAGRSAYTAAEVYELTSSAVFFLKTFKTEDELEHNLPSSVGSGFFVTGDGVAVMCYHELEDALFARVTTTDGRIFDLTGVLFYDVERDLAVVRVSRTDTEGNTVRFFPYLDLGDSDAAGVGDTVYSVSNPLGRAMDTFSSGVVANRGRTLYAEEYPFLQHTAPTSQGSSGGPIMNAYGEVIGYVYGSYANGELLELAVPVNALKGIELTGEGMPLREVRAAQREKKDAAVITADETEITVAVGEMREILISSDCPGVLSVLCDADMWDIVDLAWGDFVTVHSCILKVIGYAAGETDLRITFAPGYGNEDAELTIHVTVTGGEAEEKAEEER